MKKFLLSSAFFAVSSFYVCAETVTLQVADGTKFDGTESPEKRKDDGSLQEARKVQPLNSFEIDGYTISADKAEGSTAPAIYFPDSQKPENPTTFRVY